MRILITGAAGFVAPYLVRALRQGAPGRCEIICTGRRAAEIAGLGRAIAMDIADPSQVDAVIADFRPTHVAHLAGISAVPAASKAPHLTWTINVMGTVHVAEAVKRHVPSAVLLFASSGQVYGSSARSGEPLNENALLQPTNDYAVTKAAADLALGAQAHGGLHSIRMRAFNHAGPGQSAAFVIPGLAEQIARIEAGAAPPVLKVGNLDAYRDFLDVADVADAYVKALLQASTIAPGTVLNIASGVPRQIRGLLDHLLALSPVKISVQYDPARGRRAEIERFVGDASAARKLLNWEPHQDFDDTLRNVLTFFRQRFGNHTSS